MDAQTDSDKYSIVEFCKNFIKLGPITRLLYAVMFVCPLIGISGVCRGWGHGNVSPVLRRCGKREAVFLISRFTVIHCIHRNYKSYSTFRASTGLALDNNVLVHNRK